MNRRIKGLLPFGMLLGATATVSCTSTTTVICPVGEANCPCRPANSAAGVCNPGLVCLPDETPPTCANITGVELSQDASSGEEQSTADEPSASDDATAPASDATAPASDDATADTNSTDDSSVADGQGQSTEGGGTEGGAAETGGPPGNLVTNGDFSQGMDYWNVQGGSSASGYPSDATPYLCVTLNNGASYVVGWTPSPSFPLPVGSYAFSYKAWTTGTAVSVEAKVADSISPFQPVDFDQNNPQDSVSTSQVFTHSFTTTAVDPNVGIAFLFDGASANAGINVCFDDVTLVPQ
ncbi:MAG: hypothetical protein ABTD50_04455 [Polyangiaceae bacterium]